MLLRMLDIFSPALRDSSSHGDGQQPLPSRRELEGRLRPRLRKMPSSEGQESSPADDSLTKPHLDLRVVLPCNLHISAHGTRNLFALCNAMRISRATRLLAMAVHPTKTTVGLPCDLACGATPECYTPNLAPAVTSNGGPKT